MPAIAIVSNITGEIATEDFATPEYWCRHILEPVQFAAGMERLQQAGCNVFVECDRQTNITWYGAAYRR